MIARAPHGHLFPLAAVAMTGLPLDQVMARAVEIEGVKVIPEQWARDYGARATAQWRAGTSAPAPSPAALRAPTANVIDLGARKPERFLSPAPYIIVDGEIFFSKVPS